MITVAVIINLLRLQMIIALIQIRLIIKYNYPGTFITRFDCNDSVLLKVNKLFNKHSKISSMPVGLDGFSGS